MSSDQVPQKSNMSKITQCDTNRYRLTFFSSSYRDKNDRLMDQMQIESIMVQIDIYKPNIGWFLELYNQLHIKWSVNRDIQKRSIWNAARS